MSHLKISLLLLVGSIANSAVCQSTVTGRVIDAAGTGIPSVRVEIAALNIFSISNATGGFTLLNVTNRGHDIDFITFGNYAPLQMRNIRIQASVNLGNITLAPGALISGTALGSGGFSSTGGNLNAYDLAGNKLFTPNDTINATGQFAITVPFGYNQIRALPPVGSPLMPLEWIQTNVVGPIQLPVTIMPRGYPVSATIIDAVSGVPLANFKAVTTDALTGQVYPQITSTSNVFGAINLTLPLSICDLELTPPATAGSMPTVLKGLITVANTALGQIRIKRAVFASGSLTSSIGAVAGADIDAITPDGYKMYTPGDNTNAAGVFSIRVPAGTTKITAQPSSASGLCGTDFGTQTLAANGSFGVAVAAPGYLMTGRVFGPQGPEPAANINILDPLTGLPIIITGDHTDALGNFATIIPAGTWHIVVNANQGSQGAPLATNNFLINGPCVHDFILPTKVLITNLTTVATLTLGQGGHLPVNLFFHNLDSNSLSTYVELFVRYPSGAEVPVLPPLPIDVPPLFPLTLGPIFLPLPPIDPTQLDRELKYCVRFRSQATGLLLDQASALFITH